MTISVHLQKVSECSHHCDHDDGNVSIRFEDQHGQDVYLCLPRDVAGRIVAAFNEDRELETVAPAGGVWG